MATVAADDQQRQVSIGRVFSRAFAAIGANPAAVWGISFLFGALPQLLTVLANQLMQGITVTGAITP